MAGFSGLKLAMVSAVTLLSAGNADAAVTLTFNGVSSVWGSSAPRADISRNGPGADVSYDNLRISPYNISGTLSDGSSSTAVSLMTWCVDVFQTINTGTYGVVSLADALGGDTTKANRIAALISHEGLTKVSATHDAAVQLALWELLYEDNGTTPSFSSNIFKAWDISSSVLTEATTFAANARTIWTPSSAYTFQVAKNSQYQDQLFFTPSVPEPATWMMMIIGFGMVGASMRQRRARARVSISFG